MVLLSLLANKEIHFLPHKFTLREYQKGLFEAFLVDKLKYACIYWSRRAGKDKSCFNLLVCMALYRVGNYHIIFPEKGQAEKVIWHGIDKDGNNTLDHIPEELIKKKDNNKMMITLINGSTIQLLSAARSDNYVGISSAGMIFSEYPIQDPACLEYFMPIVLETGGFIIINGTPRGHNHGYRLRNRVKSDPQWYYSELTATELFLDDGTRAVTDEMIETAKSTMSIEKIRQEYFLDWDVALENSYFVRYLNRATQENRITRLNISPEVPVHTFWDLGINDKMAICMVQFMENGNVHFIDYYENNNHGFEHYINYLHDWRDKNGVVFGKHFAPHDIRQRELSDGQTRQDKASRLGINFIRVGRPRTDIDNIEMSRTQFKNYYFHQPKVQRLLDCIMNYHAIEKKDGQPGKVADSWGNHGTDAFMLVALAKHQGLLNSFTGIGQAITNLACQDPLI